MILKFTPPTDSLIERLGIAADQIAMVPLSSICDITVTHTDTGMVVSGYDALKHIANVIDSIAEASKAYERVRA